MTANTTDIPNPTSFVYPELQEATQTGTITIPGYKFGITLTPGTINSKPAVIATILQNSTANSMTMDVANGTYYYITDNNNKSAHMVIDLDGYSLSNVEPSRTDNLPVRTVFYDAIIHLEP